MPLEGNDMGLLDDQDTDLFGDPLVSEDDSLQVQEEGTLSPQEDDDSTVPPVDEPAPDTSNDPSLDADSTKPVWDTGNYGRRMQRSMNKMHRKAREEQERALAEQQAKHDAELTALREQVAAIHATNTASQFDAQIDGLNAQAKSALENDDMGKYHDINSQLIDLKAKKYAASQSQSTPTRADVTQQQRSPEPSLPPQNDSAVNNWLARNPWAQSDQNKYQEAQRLANEIAAEGDFDVNDPEFYDELDDRLSNYQPRQRQKPPATGHPARRSAQSQSSPRAKQLTQQQLRDMKAMGIEDTPEMRKDYLEAIELSNRQLGIKQ